MVSDIGLLAGAISIGAGAIACSYQNHAALAAAYGALAEGRQGAGLQFAQVLILTAMGESLAIFGLLGAVLIWFVVG